MKSALAILVFVTASIASLNAQPQAQTAASPSTVPDIVPRPAQVTRGEGQFVLTRNCQILVGAGVPGLRDVAEYLADRLRAAIGAKPPISPVENPTPRPDAILLTSAAASTDLGEEGYELVIGAESVVIRSRTAAGAFYAVQTIRQLLPVQLELAGASPGTLCGLPALRIEDKPRFPWRGLLLDVSRHFRDVSFVKRYIDLLAYHKMNILHWHLVDDQGWRIQIKKYPRLTEIGAWRDQEGGRYGGFYTQAEIREVVAYAASRFVTVVPEIEMPGHCNAALAAYPQYSCTGGPFKVPTIWGVFQDVYCAGNEEVFPFVQDILTEVLELFPSKWIHIGGDEVDKARWKACPKCQKRKHDKGLKDEHELQSYFIKRIGTFLEEKGRRMIGWDEILEGGLAPGATVQSWRGMDGAIAACKMNHDVIVSPTSHCYLDYSPVVTPLSVTYSLNPIPSGLTPEQARHILGVEGNMWSERTPAPADTDRQVFPRLCAIAEVGWSPAETRDFANFSSRMKVHLQRLQKMGIGYGDLGSKVGEWSAKTVSKEYKPMEWDATSIIDRPGRYELWLMYERGENALTAKWASILADGKEVARATHDSWSGSESRNNMFRIYLRMRNPGGKYSVRIYARGDGGTDSQGSAWLRCLDE